MVFVNRSGIEQQMSTPPPAPIARIAAALLGLEFLALIVLACWEIVALIGSGAGSMASALALIVMTLIGAAGLAAFAWAVVVGRSWGRSGGIVAQFLVIAVAVGSVTGAYAHPLIAVAIGAPGAITLILLLLTERADPAHRR